MQFWSKELLGSGSNKRYLYATEIVRKHSGGGNAYDSIVYTANKLEPNITQECYDFQTELKNISGFIGDAQSSVTFSWNGYDHVSNATPEERNNLFGESSFYYRYVSYAFSMGVVISPQQQVGDVIYGYAPELGGKYYVTLNNEGTGGSILMYYRNGGTYTDYILSIGESYKVPYIYRG